MENSNVPHAIYALPWIGAEGRRNGRPLLIRARRVPDALIGSAGFPSLFVLTLSYQAVNESGLPTPAQYEEIAKFERDVLDRLESDGFGAAVVIRTCDGSVRYFCYVRNVAEAARAVQDATGGHQRIEMASDDDPTWNQYKQLMAMISR